MYVYPWKYIPGLLSSLDQCRCKLLSRNFLFLINGTEIDALLFPSRFSLAVSNKV